MPKQASDDSFDVDLAKKKDSRAYRLETLAEWMMAKNLRATVQYHCRLSHQQFFSDSLITSWLDLLVSKNLPRAALAFSEGAVSME